MNYINATTQGLSSGDQLAVHDMCDKSGEEIAEAIVATNYENSQQTNTAFIKDAPARKKVCMYPADNIAMVCEKISDGCIITQRPIHVDPPHGTIKAGVTVCTDGSGNITSCEQTFEGCVTDGWANLSRQQPQPHSATNDNTKIKEEFRKQREVIDAKIQTVFAQRRQVAQNIKPRGFILEDKHLELIEPESQTDSVLSNEKMLAVANNDGFQAQSNKRYSKLEVKPHNNTVRIEDLFNTWTKEPHSASNDNTEIKKEFRRSRVDIHTQHWNKLSEKVANSISEFETKKELENQELEAIAQKRRLELQSDDGFQAQSNKRYSKLEVKPHNNEYRQRECAEETAKINMLTVEETDARNRAHLLRALLDKNKTGGSVAVVPTTQPTAEWRKEQDKARATRLQLFNGWGDDGAANDPIIAKMEEDRREKSNKPKYTPARKPQYATESMREKLNTELHSSDAEPVARVQPLKRAKDYYLKYFLTHNSEYDGGFIVRKVTDKQKLAQYVDSSRRYLAQITAYVDSIDAIAKLGIECMGELRAQPSLSFDEIHEQLTVLTPQYEALGHSYAELKKQLEPAARVVVMQRVINRAKEIN